jgi:hypothetical protein
MDSGIHKKLDDIHQDVKGVRTRLERHDEETMLAVQKEHRLNALFRLNIFRHFKEWLEAMRSKE